MAQNLKNIASLNSRQLEDRDQLCAYLALGWRPTITAIACGTPVQMITVEDTYPNGKVIKDQNGNAKKVTRAATLCAINALSISLRAARTLNERRMVVRPTPDEILAIFNNKERWIRAYRTKLGENFQVEEDDAYQKLVEDYDREEFLEHTQISLLLDLINEDFGLQSIHYRLGHVTQAGEVGIENDYGPIVWIGHVGIGTGRHWLGFSHCQPRRLDNRLNLDYLYQRTQRIVEDGLYRFIQETNSPDGTSVIGRVGEFLFQRPREDVAEGNVYGRIGEVPTNNHSIPLDHLQRIERIVPRAQAAPNTTAGPGPKAGPSQQQPPSQQQAPANADPEPDPLEEYVKGKAIPDKAKVPIAPDNSMEDLVMYFTKGARKRQQKDKDAVNALYWERDEIMLQVNAANAQGQVEVRNIDSVTGFISQDDLIPIDEPWGIPRVYPAQEERPKDYADRIQWPLRELQAEVKRRKNADAESAARGGLRPQAYRIYRPWLIADDAMLKARKRKEALNIRQVVNQYRAAYRGLGCLLYLGPSGSNYSFAVDVEGRGVQILNSSLPLAADSGIPPIPWGIQVPAGSNPSVLRFEDLPPPDAPPPPQESADTITERLRTDLTTFTEDKIWIGGDEAQEAEQLLILLNRNRTLKRTRKK